MSLGSRESQSLIKYNGLDVDAKAIAAGKKV